MSSTTGFPLLNVSGDSSNGSTFTAPPHDISFQMRIVTLLIIILCGTIGNVLSFLVLIRRRMRITSVYFYLTVLACSDTLVLYMSAFKTWIFELSGFEFMRVSDASCKLTNFLVLLGLYTSSWVIVLLTIDRCVAVCFPLRAAWLCSVQHARKLTVGLLALICLYNFHVFWTFGLFERRGKIYCCTDPAIPFMMYPFEILKLASYCFLPFALVLLMNSAIICQIRSARSASLSTQNSSRSGGSSGSGASHARVTYMLLTVSFTWFFMTAPFSLLIFLGSIQSNRIVRTIIFLLMYTNHSVNFFLYCFTGRKFRRELRELFRCCWRKKAVQSLELKSKATDKSVLTAGDHEKAPLRVCINSCNGTTASEV